MRCSAQTPTHMGCPVFRQMLLAWMASYLIKLDGEGLSLDLRNTESLAPRKLRCCFSVSIYQTAIPPFGFAPNDSELLSFLSALSYFPPQRLTKPECPTRVGTRGAYV